MEKNIVYLAFGALAVVLVALAFILSAPQGTTGPSCDNVNSTLEKFVAASRYCTVDSDCAVAYYSCGYGGVRAGAADMVTQLQKQVDRCYPQACPKSVVTYDFFCGNGTCQTIVNGYTDRLYEDLVNNRTECSNSNVSGYNETDHCFLALRLKTRYKSPVVQEFICKQISDMRVRADCLSISDQPS